MAKNSYDIVFCGNPGVGKSTLLSCLSGIQFTSGLHFGSGLTDQLQFYANPAIPTDIRWADTPGLADIKKKELAAKQITNALRDGANKNRRLLLVFVLTLESGRVKPDDILTIEKVMESIEAPGYDLTRNSFGIVVNKCSFLKKPDKAREGINVIRTQFATDLSRYRTNYIEFVKVYEELEDEENATTKVDGLMAFVLGLKGINIKVANKIDVSNIEEAKEKLALEWNQKVRQIQQASAEQKAQWEREKEQLRRDMQSKMQEAAREREAIEGIRESMEAMKLNAARSEEQMAQLRQQLAESEAQRNNERRRSSSGCTIL